VARTRLMAITAFPVFDWNIPMSKGFFTLGDYS